MGVGKWEGMDMILRERKEAKRLKTGIEHLKSMKMRSEKAVKSRGNEMEEGNQRDGMYDRD